MQGYPSTYDAAFYADGGGLAYRAAQIILTEIREVHSFASVVDFGCGAGGWLRAAADLIGQAGAVPALLGIDGPHARAFAECPGAQFIFQDLEHRIRVPNTFQLAISMEVAEHLTEARAAGFVEDLTRASDVILFSAAIPGQGGTHHINEQWQSYWIEMFAARDYACFDILRPRLWRNAVLALCPFYIANAFLYVRNQHSLIGRLEAMHSAVQAGKGKYPTDVVHPELFRRNHIENAGPRSLLQQLPRAVARAIARRLRRNGG